MFTPQVTLQGAVSTSGDDPSRGDLSSGGDGDPTRDGVASGGYGATRGAASSGDVSSRGDGPSRSQQTGPQDRL
jgi:hypothetical protein